ncbi:MAG: ABC transporter ATP-binding protein [Capsulimonas sp.]|uniref:ABC transporter ATP-binding protein n=1 Tax=Capsulimonas sp. TaxID=2494211 RepID=UPI003264F427
MGSVLEVSGLTRRYGAKTALDNVSLKINTGSVFGLIGENGAGKSTFIKHLVGLLSPQQGTVRVFGKDPVADPVEVLSRIGYLPEENDLPPWMRVRDLTAYMESFYPSWDREYAEQLRRSFGIEPKARIKELSKGQKTRVSLIFALAYRPDLLVLDEPSAGLDPILRRDLLNAIVRTIADEGRTVLFSSHSLHEVEQTCDHVAMIRSGVLVLCDTLPRIKNAHFRIRLPQHSPDLSHSGVRVIAAQSSVDGYSAVCFGSPTDMDFTIEKNGVNASCVEPVNLEEIFMAYSDLDMTDHLASLKSE